MFLLFDHIVTVAVIDSDVLLANMAVQHSMDISQYHYLS